MKKNRMESCSEQDLTQVARPAGSVLAVGVIHVEVSSCDISGPLGGVTPARSAHHAHRTIWISMLFAVSARINHFLTIGQKLCKLVRPITTAPKASGTASKCSHAGSAGGATHRISAHHITKLSYDNR